MAKLDPPKAQLKASNQELKRRYNEALKLLRRVYKAANKPHWGDGETLDAVLSDVDHLLGMERKERGYLKELKKQSQGK